eukprot:TRINITY_DN69_c12_g1_i1.p1 TRINITY_DN69_c12_g1~~TRINITY_DN69_c12_g1_i1.p1  ORF type:complete len:383 (-),score=97.34 TRINITY_DN69_c12_g1_i1:121-1188(-)
MDDDEEKKRERRYNLNNTNTILNDKNTITSNNSNKTPSNNLKDNKNKENKPKGEKILCPICMIKIDAKAPVWNCFICHTMLHLNCAKDWAENQPKNPLSENFPALQQMWNCVNCRHQVKGIPKNYYCFCGKKKNPEFSSWDSIEPHSCGKVCGRTIKPCNHKCTKSCHSKSCVCTEMVEKKCDCGKESKKVKCQDLFSTPNYSCKKVCGKKLKCGHTCNKLCGEKCSCEKETQVLCKCNKEKISVKCFLINDSSFVHSCKNVCGKKFPNCSHKCEKVCCEGCEEKCPFTFYVCGCGKEKNPNPSCAQNNSTPFTCGQFCGKLFNCGADNHFCKQRCHGGSCGDCNTVEDKKCECG